MNLLYICNNAVVVCLFVFIKNLHLEELAHIYSLCSLKQLKALKQVLILRTKVILC